MTTPPCLYSAQNRNEKQTIWDKFWSCNFLTNKVVIPKLSSCLIWLVFRFINNSSVSVAEQRVTGPKLQGCVACVKPGTKIRINIAASIHEWRRILSWSENQGSWMCMGCMENGLSVCVGRWRRYWWSGATLHSWRLGGNKDNEEWEEDEACGRSQWTLKKKEEQSVKWRRKKSFGEERSLVLERSLEKF